ncbi:hypothetical protein BOX15_Mlig019546g2 [Macrostomum lignano]|uniref:Uncharacterized protein n=3 Tax=Macrostomum lignano TaxID=282301 RepID=A0A267FYC4_9PLAT|nr:hypothetical protein BOX15_Mlig019546g2 [Macrostomum lignano]
MFEIFWQPEIRKYKAGLCSKAFVFSFMCVAATFVFPIIIVYRSHGFWATEDTYREQPAVGFKRQAILQLQTSQQQYTWSTYPNLNNLQQSNLLSPVLRIREVDSNLDGRNDFLHLQMEIPLADTESVQSVGLMLVFDYWIVRMSNFRMESLALINYDSSLAGSTLTVSGDLTLNQKELLGYKGTDQRYVTPVVNSSSMVASDYKLSTIFAKYQKRNITTSFENALYSWETGRPAGEPFKINATIFYTTPLISYRPGFWYALKWAWVQYVSVMLIFLFIVDRVKVFVFENQIVPSVVQRPHFDCKRI